MPDLYAVSPPLDTSGGDPEAWTCYAVNIDAPCSMYTADTVESYSIQESLARLSFPHMRNQDDLIGVSSLKGVSLCILIQYTRQVNEYICNAGTTRWNGWDL